MSETLELKHSSGARAEVYLFGATVTAFYTAKEPNRNVLFLSKKAALDGSKPIRGGIPLVFPIFGSAKGFPNHGFARTSRDWKAQVTPQVDGKNENPVVARFTLQASDATQAMWNHAFELVYEVKLFADQLITALHVHNKSTSEDISFQALLHTYLNVDDARAGKCLVKGLQGVEYHDKLTNKKQKETREAIQFDQETDAVYANAPAKITVHMNKDSPKSRGVEIVKEAFLQDKSLQKSDVVVWNPWIDKSKGMADFGDEEYINMVCVEPGRVSEFQQLAANGVFTLQQTIKPCTSCTL